MNLRRDLIIPQKCIDNVLAIINYFKIKTNDNHLKALSIMSRARRHRNRREEEVDASLGKLGAGEKRRKGMVKVLE